EQVKFNIFRRINTGGMPLTNQEVRHALHQGAATRFLQRLVQNKIFAAATDKSVNDARMEGRELLLRVIVHFLLPLNDKISKIDIENEMNKAMRVLNHIGGTPEKSKEPLPVYNPYTLDALEALIIQGLSRAATLFRDYAFRKAVPPNKRTPINKALFETWTSCLGEIPEENWERLMGNIARFRNDAWGLLQDPVFLDTVGNRGYLTCSIQHRYASVRAIIDNNLKG
ncbi:MAG: hypothetical protein IJU37_05835, partial [Desulfovibrio sp.]|nr:hypothetical protein [Desulfovibrio sp.]